jgi:hypothetical protein
MSNKINKVEDSIIRKVINWENEKKSLDKDDIRREIEHKIKMAKYLTEDWQIQLATERIMKQVNAKKIDQTDNIVDTERRKTLLGWTGVVLSFVLIPIGAIASLCIGVYIVTNKDHNKTLGITTIIFASAIILLYLLLLKSL